MQLYSKITKKFYEENEKDILLKEEEAEKKRLKKEKAEAFARSNDKRLMAGQIEEAEKTLNEALEYEANQKKQCAVILEKSQEEATKIINEGNAEVQRLLDEAAGVVTEARHNRYNAIKAFNEKYGTYTKTITGEEAKKEIDKATSDMSWIKDILNPWFF